ncbi:phosphatase PAP2 family protein [Paenibacillus lemnae]|uniref:Inositol phosphorylceramide synthase n=1 Tax=Paenibacillus lemnae TaxID=1330551 RepID=A0A848M914_PAELE|nr:phosphatase PAP2 family protein [Paenibacillus lemnae]NMO96749.1 inositol phosphorylceramide synthase [Paenibacillus lemnae]
MNTITLFTTLNIIGLLWIGTLANPFKAIYALIRELITNYRFLLLFGAMAGIFLLNKMEQQYELDHPVQADYTSWMFLWEGQFVRHLQEIFYTPWLTPILAYFYLLVFQAVIIGSLGVYLIQQNKTLVYAVCYAILINYAIAIPFFLLFPVNEVWSYAPAGVTFYMLDVFPAFETIYRPLSGLDNCFPSLHTSLSVTMALLAFKSGNKRWAWMTGISAFIIVFSIFYLGIHWVSDMLAGVTLAVLASTAGLYLGKWTNAKSSELPLLKRAA